MGYFPVRLVRMDAHKGGPKPHHQQHRHTYAQGHVCRLVGPTPEVMVMVMIIVTFVVQLLVVCGIVKYT